MRIAIFTQQYGSTWSGVGTYSFELANAMSRGGHEVMVLEPGQGEDRLEDNVQVRKIGSWKIDRPLNYWLPVSYRFKAAARKLKEDFKPDIIHFTDAREALFANLKATVAVGTMNDCYAAVLETNPMKMKRDYSDWKKRYLYYRAQTSLEPFALRALTRIIANSEYVKNIIVDKYGISHDVVDVVYYGIQPDKVVNDGEEKVRLEGTPAMLFVGSNWERKGLNTLIDALGQIVNDFPEARLHVVGDDPKRPIIEDKAIRLGVLSNIKFHGRMSNEKVRRLSADMLVMPSLVEAFGIVYLEAMAGGMPSIGTTNGGTVELIKSGVNGFTVKPGHASSLALRITVLIKNHALREKIIEEGKKTAAKYTVERMAQETLEVYRKALEAPGD